MITGGWAVGSRVVVVRLDVSEAEWLVVGGDVVEAGVHAQGAVAPA